PRPGRAAARARQRHRLSRRPAETGETRENPLRPVRGAAMRRPAATPAAEEHCRVLLEALRRFQQHGLADAAAWGRELARVLPAGGRLLAAGNGGSAAQAQHLTAELVGRYAADRRPYSAL